MAVNPKELKALQKQWDGAKAQGNAELPDGVYEFVITKAVPDTSKWGMKITYRVTGGNEALIGEDVSIKDNLDSDSNMGWFKKKLARLGISLPSDVSLLFATSTEEDSVAAQLIGKKFEGQAKTKNEFLNVYVNRLIGEADPSELEDQAAGAETAAEGEEAVAEEGGEEAATSELAEGVRVSFTTQKGEDLEGDIIEVLEGDKYRIDADGRKFQLPADRLTVVAAAEEASEEAAEEPAEEAAEEPAEEAEAAPVAKKGKVKVAKPKIIAAMKLPELKAFLAKAGLKVEALRQPREFAAGVAGFVHEPKYMPEVKHLAALASGLNVKVMKNAKPAEVVKSLRLAALAKFSI